MKRSHTYLRRAVTLGLLGWLVLTPSPGIAAKATGRAVIWFDIIGTGNPDLHYVFTGLHEAVFTEYTGLEAVAPAVYQGRLHRNSSRYTNCTKWGFVSSPRWICERSFTISCPYAEGRWSAQTRISASLPPVGKVWNWYSPSTVYANCPPPFTEPPGCNGPYTATKILAVDLETGRVLQPQWHFEAPQGLTRNEMIDGKSYFQEEWAILSSAAPGTTVTHWAASEQAREQVETWASALADTPGFRAESRYLVIEAARHIRHRVEPLVRLESLRTGTPVQARLPDGRVMFRARFSPQGELEDVETLEGDQQAARKLAEDLRLEFQLAHDEGEGHEEHRAVVFATFEVENGRSRFVSAVPTLPQCCCNESWCI